MTGQQSVDLSQNNSSEREWMKAKRRQEPAVVTNGGALVTTACSKLQLQIFTRTDTNVQAKTVGQS